MQLREKRKGRKNRMASRETLISSCQKNGIRVAEVYPMGETVGAVRGPGRDYRAESIGLRVDNVVLLNSLIFRLDEGAMSRFTGGTRALMEALPEQALPPQPPRRSF
jgi:hypothetical protein